MTAPETERDRKTKCVRTNNEEESEDTGHRSAHVPWCKELEKPKRIGWIVDRFLKGFLGERDNLLGDNAHLVGCGGHEQ
jgi:hypothetical protein